MKSGVKLQRLTEERETTFGLSYREDQKIEGSRNSDSNVSYFEASHTPSLPSIDRVVKSETYKRNS